MTIFLVVLYDEPVEIESAWSSRDLAQKEIERRRLAVSLVDSYWLENRLSVVEMELDRGSTVPAVVTEQGIKLIDVGD